MAIRFVDSFQVNDGIRKGWQSTSWGNAGPMGGVHPYGGLNVYFSDNYNHGLQRVITPNSAKTIIGLTCAPAASFAGGSTGAGIRVGNGSDVVGAIWASATNMQAVRNGVVIGSTTFPYPANNLWQRHEMEVTFSPTVGTLVYKIDGVTVFNLTNVNTSTTTNPGSNLYINGMNNGRWYFIDLVVMDGIDGTTLTPPQDAPYNTMLGDLRMSVHSPVGAGASTQWIPSTGANWAALDEQPPSDTDYVSSATSGHRDLYAFSDRANAGTILAVAVNSQTNKDDAGAMSLRHVAKSAAAAVVSPDLPVNAGILVMQSVFAKDPNTSAPWTEASFNAAEFGFEVV